MIICDNAQRTTLLEQCYDTEGHPSLQAARMECTTRLEKKAASDAQQKNLRIGAPDSAGEHPVKTSLDMCTQPAKKSPSNGKAGCRTSLTDWIWDCERKDALACEAVC